MAAAKLIERLEHVRQVAPQRWLARCPAHQDRSPSLSIRELDDGRVLIHDFGGCETGDVLAAVGLGVVDLFPERATDHARGAKPNHWHARKEAFETIHKDSLLVALAAESLAAGIPLTLNDRNKLCDAAARVRYAIEVCR